MLKTLFFILLLLDLIYLSYVDFKKLILPDSGIILLAISGIALSFTAQQYIPENTKSILKETPIFVIEIKQRLLLAAAVLFAWILCAVIGVLFKTGVPFGFGDCKLFAAIAIGFGKAVLIKTVLASFLFSGIAAALLLLLKQKNKKDQIAFGPFISLGLIICYLFPTCV